MLSKDGLSKQRALGAVCTSVDLNALRAGINASNASLEPACCRLVGVVLVCEMNPACLRACACQAFQLPSCWEE